MSHAGVPAFSLAGARRAELRGPSSESLISQAEVSVFAQFLRKYPQSLIFVIKGRRLFTSIPCVYCFKSGAWRNWRGICAIHD